MTTFLDDRKYRYLRLRLRDVPAQRAWYHSQTCEQYYRYCEFLYWESVGKQDSRIKLNAHGLSQIAEIAANHGVSVRTYLEALMHFGISVEKRSGSWEAQGFDFYNYDRRNDNAYADRWF